MVMESLRAVNYLKKEKINVELIDPISIRPLDIKSILRSVQKTKRLLVIDNGWLFSSVASEITAKVAEELGAAMKLSIKRMGFADATCPTARSLEELYYPNAKTIAQTAHQMVTGKDGWVPVQDDLKDQLVFKGPF
jgi:pyruvate/2-oxoglutarate/acetoin dehydrogenase E1 component